MKALAGMETIVKLESHIVDTFAEWRILYGGKMDAR